MENKNLPKELLDNLPDLETQKEIVAKIEAEKAALEQAVEEGRMTEEEKEERHKEVLGEIFNR